MYHALSYPVRRQSGPEGQSEARMSESVPSCRRRRRRADADAAKDCAFHCRPPCSAVYSTGEGEQTFERGRRQGDLSRLDRHQEALQVSCEWSWPYAGCFVCHVFPPPRGGFWCARFVFPCESKEVCEKRGTGSDWLRQSPLFPCVVSTTG